MLAANTSRVVMFGTTLKKNGTPEGTRTPNLLIRSQTLYPIELRVHALGAGQGVNPPKRMKSRFLVSSLQKIKGHQRQGPRIKNPSSSRELSTGKGNPAASAAGPKTSGEPSAEGKILHPGSNLPHEFARRPYCGSTPIPGGGSGIDIATTMPSIARQG